MNNKLKEDELYHYGRLGQKWGQRIFSKNTGTGTTKRKKSEIMRAAEKVKIFLDKIRKKRYEAKLEKIEKEKRIADANAKAKAKQDLNRKGLRNVSSEELSRRITRLEKEKRLRDLQLELSSPKQKVRRAIVQDVIANSLKNAATDVLTNALKKFGANAVDRYIFGGQEKTIKKEASKFKEKVKEEYDKQKNSTVNNFNFYSNGQKTNSYNNSNVKEAEYQDVTNRRKLLHSNRRHKMKEKNILNNE